MLLTLVLVYLLVTIAIGLLAAGAAGGGGSSSSDTTPPAKPVIALGSGISTDTTVAGYAASSSEAVQASGVVTVVAESGSTVTVTFTNGTQKVTKTVTGAGSTPVAVTLTAADLGTGTSQLNDGTITVSAVAKDAAGNSSEAGTATFTLDAEVAVSATVVDGYVQGATVFADLNANNVKDANEPSATTNSSGVFSFDTREVLTGKQIVSLGGIDSDTKAEVPMLKALHGNTVVTPLTTLYTTVYVSSGESAATTLLTNLGVSSTDLNTDHVAALTNASTATAAGNALKLQALSQNVLVVVQAATKLAVGLGATDSAASIAATAFSNVANLSSTNLTKLTSTSATDAASVMSTVFTAVVSSKVSSDANVLTAVSSLVTAAANSVSAVTANVAQTTATQVAAVTAGTATVDSIKTAANAVLDVTQVGMNGLSSTVLASAASLALSTASVPILMKK